MGKTPGTISLACHRSVQEEEGGDGVAFNESTGAPENARRTHWKEGRKTGAQLLEPGGV